MEYYYSAETRELTGETFFSYKVLPPSDSYPPSMTNMTSLANNNSYVLPVETFPVDNFTIYDDFMQEPSYQETGSKAREYPRYQADYSGNYGLEQAEDYQTGQDTRNNITDYDLPLVFEPLVGNLFVMIEMVEIMTARTPKPT